MVMGDLLELRQGEVAEVLACGFLILPAVWAAGRNG
jgi:hypothetical protein